MTVHQRFIRCLLWKNSTSSGTEHAVELHQRSSHKQLHVFLKPRGKKAKIHQDHPGSPQSTVVTTTGPWFLDQLLLPTTFPYQFKSVSPSNGI